MENKLLIELFIDEEDKENGLDIISFVSAPAIEKDFMHFKKDNNFNFKSTNEEKRIVTGACMIPNQEIIRLDAEGNPYFVYFTEETILKAQEVFSKYGKTKTTNFEHEEETLNGVTVVESWIVEDPKNDKSNALGFKDVSKGSWFVSYKVDNDDLWEKVKNGEVKGFSIEGVFSKNIVEMSKNESCLDTLKAIVKSEDLTDNQMFDKIAEILSK